MPQPDNTTFSIDYYIYEYIFNPISKKICFINPNVITILGGLLIIPMSYNLLNNNDNITNIDNNKLLSKLDYIIHLLEEQHNEKTNYITEELILYLFLGIFILFVLDSFARASKYVR